MLDIFEVEGQALKWFVGSVPTAGAKSGDCRLPLSTLEPLRRDASSEGGVEKRT